MDFFIDPSPGLLWRFWASEPYSGNIGESGYGRSLAEDEMRRSEGDSATNILMTD